MLSDSLPTDLPLVSLTLGDRPDALLSASTFGFDFFQIRAMDQVTVSRPVRFRYARARGGFELPLAGLITISFGGGVITSARVSPHSGDLTAHEAYEVAAGVIPRIAGAGYRSVTGLGKGVETLPEKLRERERPIDTTILIGKWTCGDDALLLEVERSIFGSSEKKSEPKHVVRIRIENGPLSRRATAGISGAGRDVVWKRKLLAPS